MRRSGVRLFSPAPDRTRVSRFAPANPLFFVRIWQIAASVTRNAIAGGKSRSARGNVLRPEGTVPRGEARIPAGRQPLLSRKESRLFGEAAMPAQQALFAEPPADLLGPKGQMRRGKPNLLSGEGKMPPWIAFLSGRSGKWVRQASSCLAASQTCHRARQRCMPEEQRSLLGWHLRQCYSQLQMRRSHRGSDLRGGQ